MVNNDLNFHKAKAIVQRGGVLFTPEKMYEMAENCRQSNNLNEANTLYLRIIESYPESREAGWAKFRTNDFSRAEKNSEVEEKIKENYDDIMITTAPFIEGYRVVKTFDIITSECAYGINFLFDFFTELTDIFGGKSETIQKALRNARKTCLLELKKEAKSIGANGIIAVDLDYSEFSGKGKSMLFLVASGTAVKLEEIYTKGIETNLVDNSSC